MTEPSSKEYWSLANLDGTNEVILHQQGWSVTTVGGSRYDLPPRRGTDMTIAYRPGQLHRAKTPDVRPITLQMFMVGWDPATGHAPDDQLTQWNDNWEILRRKVFSNYMLQDQRIRLIRRWFLTNPTFPTNRGGQDICIQGDPGVPPAGKQLLTAFANAEMTGTMAPSMTGRFRAEFTMDFTLADPYFYGNNVSATVNTSGPVYVWNDGYDVAASGYMQVDFYGPLTNPVLTNISTNPDSYVKYNATIASGGHVRLLVGRYSCLDLTNGAVNTISKITSYGARFWVNLLPGTNKLTLTDDNTSSGYAVVSFRAPYV